MNDEIKTETLFASDISKVFKIGAYEKIYSVRFEYNKIIVSISSERIVHRFRSTLHLHCFNDGNAVIFMDTDRGNRILVPDDQFIEISGGMGFVYQATDIMIKKLKVSYKAWENRWC